MTLHPEYRHYRVLAYLVSLVACVLMVWAFDYLSHINPRESCDSESVIQAVRLTRYQLVASFGILLSCGILRWPHPGFIFAAGFSLWYPTALLFFAICCHESYANFPLYLAGLPLLLLLPLFGYNTIWRRIAIASPLAVLLLPLVLLLGLAALFA